MIVKRISPISGEENQLDLPVTQEQLDRFVNRRETGEYISDIFPHLANLEKEYLLSGICPKEWQELFPEEEDDDDDTPM